MLAVLFIGHMAYTSKQDRRAGCKPARFFETGHMAKLVDALDLGSSGETHQSSSLCMPTKFSAF